MAAGAAAAQLLGCELNQSFGPGSEMKSNVVLFRFYQNKYLDDKIIL